MDKTQLKHSIKDRVVSFARAFPMSSIFSSNYEIMQLPDTGGIPCVRSNVTSNWVIIKMLYMYLRRCLLSWHRSRLGFVTPSIGEVSLGPHGNAHHNKPCKQKTNELVTR